MAIFQSLCDAAATGLLDGDTVTLESFNHLILHAAADEAIRQGQSESTLIGMTLDIGFGQFIGMGLAKKLVFSYVGNPGVGLLRPVSNGVENGYSPSIPTLQKLALNRKRLRPAW